MQEMEQEQNKTEVIEQEQQVLSPDAIYKNNIYALVDDVKQEPQFKNKSDEELKQDKSFFPILVDYIYKKYIGELLGNNTKNKVIYNDIDLIDNIFDIYTHLVYTYKWNNRPSLIEFSIFSGINQNTFYDWLKGNNDNSDLYINNNTNESMDNTVAVDKRKHITSRYTEKVQKWQSVCERALYDGNGEMVKEIFLLKARHNYKDSCPVEVNINHKQVISADELPQLIGLKT